MVLLVLVLAVFTNPAFSTTPLSPNFYDQSCPNALNTIKRVVAAAILKETRMGASLLRLHFHDCFVNGCDGSVLLDATPTIDSEKNALPNLNSVRGFEVIDEIKKEVDQACGGHVVSCADILAVAARDSIVALGGPRWEVNLGRRDSRNASRVDANNNLPSPFSDLAQLTESFNKQGLDQNDLVLLSAAHTIGFARCVTFRNRIYNDSNIDPLFAARLQYTVCPRTGGDDNLAPLDSTPAIFDGSYFLNLVQKKGILHSDQALFNGGSTDALVKQYILNHLDFYKGFASSMVKMGNIKPLTGNEGEIRVNCRSVN
ncbi:peroxidase P7-like [Neltuma alba]|uniref:peroxidase P7-like n=1 Tax=Neltuma alba TaxID=207710 RepID=UPI0010A4A471|nr:peroxidase P7-like [Prosopis alba]